MIKAEYIWMDGTEPTAKLRSKTKIFPSGTTEFTEWGFDGSSTNQAPGENSECMLVPVANYPDPIRGGEHRLVLCEVMDDKGNPHPTNTRAPLRAVVEKTKSHDPLFGIEQEYTMFKAGRPLGWPEGGYPPPQGPFYCGIGADEVFGREIVEEHMEACLKADLGFYGINAEVMPAQWEFQIGTLGPMEVSDQMLIARYLLYRIAEPHNVVITLHPKPVRGDWNGAGAHTNYSTRSMREEGGMKHILDAINKLEKKHDLHIANYGSGIEQRLTGKHETCSYREFKYGVAHRGASVRIPLSVHRDGKGYFEDRRPCANIDPYVVVRLLLDTTLLS